MYRTKRAEWEPLDHPWTYHHFCSSNIHLTHLTGTPSRDILHVSIIDLATLCAPKLNLRGSKRHSRLFPALTRTQLLTDILIIFPSLSRTHTLSLTMGRNDYITGYWCKGGVLSIPEVSEFLSVADILYCIDLNVPRSLSWDPFSAFQMNDIKTEKKKKNTPEP